jgi:glycolate oxidase iron-sulfur subunit
MQTALADFIKDTPDGKEADAILRKCVHCGFCTATCPTYQLLGDELDGPRGRIYLIKRVLEGETATQATQLHLDRCLTCRNCETTCPSGVQYGRLVDIGRKVVDEQVGRGLGQKLVRTALKVGLTSSAFAPAMKVGQLVRGALPAKLQAKVPPPQAAGAWPVRQHARKMLLLEGCVQPAMAPNINTATARVLDALGVQLLRPAKAGCCGAIRHHLNDHDGGLDDARRNVDAWWPAIEPGAEAGAEAIIINASGCGTQVKEYAHLLRHDPLYAAKAERVSALAKDVVEVLAAEAPRLQTLTSHDAPGPRRLVCCGSAGTYSVLQPELSTQLRDRKLGQVQAVKPQAILSANIGCITHLASGTDTPVMHWIEWVDHRLRHAG